MKTEMNNRRVELLAPAGSWEAFVAAVENGADAIYMGGKLFNARQFAGNFDNEQLKKALDYAHLRDVKIYLTMNTLVNDEEMEEAVNQVGEAYKAGIDGVIVQDLGLAALIRKVFPDLDLHASTQMTLYNVQGVKALEELGFKRAVLARELSLQEIGEIARSTPLEIEVFIHGALCISYSGQCLMSSFIGGRSGNRGKCAQPCRMKYELISDGNEARSGKDCRCGEAAYVMSPKDICSINELKDLVDAGVTSLKIEGRMKTPEYVATVVRIYRKYLDSILAGKSDKLEEKDLRELTQIFNRGGFSKGYLRGKTGSDMMSYEKPKNWGIHLGEVLSYDRNTKTVKVKLRENIAIGDGIEVWNGEDESPGTIVTEIKVNAKNVTEAQRGDIAVLGSLKSPVFNGNKVYKTSEKRLNITARESFEGRSVRKSGIAGKVTAKWEMPLTLAVKDSRGNNVEATGEILPEKALNKPLTSERLQDQISKTGSTPFAFQDLQVELDEGLSVPVSEINNVRRKALEQLEEKKVRSFERNMSEEMRNTQEKLLHFPGNSRNPSGETKISLFLYTYAEGYPLEELKADRVYVPFSALLEEAARKRLGEDIARKTGEIFLWIPNITRGNYDRLIKTKLPEAVELGIDGILAGNPWIFTQLKSVSSIKIAGDYSLNLYNSFSLQQMAELGLHGAALSLELNLEQMAEIENMSNFQKEAIVYGRIPVMTSEYCPVGSLEGGHNSKNRCNNACLRGLYRLRDRKGMDFPILCDRIDCRSTLLNTNVIYAADNLDKIRSAGVDIMRINLSDESPEEARQLVKMHRDVLDHGTGALKRYDRLIEEIKRKGFTKGHYFRGV